MCDSLDLMRIKSVVLFLIGYGLCASAQAQLSIQRYYLESVGFEYVSQKASAKRCVQWRDLVDKNPVIEYEAGKPYVMLELEARVEGNCPLTFANGQSLNFSAGEGSIKVFRFKVSPPSVTFLISGPGFSDQLFFEALASQPDQVGFFNFFENAQTRFDLGYGTFSTSNNQIPAGQRSSNVFPIMSGLITVPFPWYRRVQFGFSLSQNLSNVYPDKDIQFQFSEFAFDTRYVFGIKNNSLSLVGEVRGRNWYQLGDMRPFVVRSSPGVGFGMDYDAWLGTTKWGYTISSRYGFRSAADAKSLGELRAGFSVNYKFSHKWALGMGYRWTRLGVDFSESSNQPGLGKLYEQSHLINISLILISNRGGAAK